MVSEEIQRDYGDREKLQVLLDRVYTRSDSSNGAGMV